MLKRLVILIVFVTLLTCLFSGCMESDVYSGYWFDEEHNTYAKIEKTNKGYTWMEKDNKYTVEVEKDKLIVDVGGLKATVTYDEKEEVMLVTLWGSQTKYKKVSKGEYEKNVSKDSN